MSKLKYVSLRVGWSSRELKSDPKEVDEENKRVLEEDKTQRMSQQSRNILPRSSKVEIHWPRPNCRASRRSTSYPRGELFWVEPVRPGPQKRPKSLSSPPQEGRGEAHQRGKDKRKQEETRAAAGRDNKLTKGLPEPLSPEPLGPYPTYFSCIECTGPL